MSQNNAQVAANGTDKPLAGDVLIARRPTMEIIIPLNMKFTEAADWLIKKDKEEDKVIKVYHEIDAFPLDGAVSFRAALDEIYGFVQNSDTPSWFGPQPPTMVGVPVGPNQIKQVPWGRVIVPGVFGHLQTSLTSNPYPKFVIAGETKQRHLFEIENIVNKTKEMLKTKSIYKGKAIRLDLSWLRLGQEFSVTGHAPTFTIPVDSVREDELIFSDAVRQDIDLGLFTPIECADHCRKHKIPLKRGVLLAGPYGTGKTLTAYVTAKKAVDNGWTFIYLSNVLDLAQAFKFAKQYAPAVIFAEDVDRAVGEERTENIDAILNSFDGVDSKNAELITVLTTNHVERLTQAILRPGRCDTLVMVTPPDAEAAARLIRLYGRGLIAEDADFKRMGAALDGHLPAEIREAVERAKLNAIRRLTRIGEMPPDGIKGHVREDDVLAAVKMMNLQHKMLEPKPTDQRSTAEKCADLLGSRVAAGVREGMQRPAAILLNMVQQAGLVKAEDVRAARYALSDDDDQPTPQPQPVGANGHG
jgi:transitional endoplasmic reticulum ATPase